MPTYRIARFASHRVAPQGHQISYHVICAVHGISYQGSTISKLQRSATKTQTELIAEEKNGTHTKPAAPLLTQRVAFKAKPYNVTLLPAANSLDGAFGDVDDVLWLLLSRTLWVLFLHCPKMLATQLWERGQTRRNWVWEEGSASFQWSQRTWGLGQATNVLPFPVTKPVIILSLVPRVSICGKKKRTHKPKSLIPWEF